MYRLRICAVLIALSLAATLAGAPAGAQDELDPPTHAARLSYAEGAVSLQPAGVDSWTAATVNRPLTTGDQLWSDRRSRAELELDSAVVRIGASSNVSLVNLSDAVTQLRITSGTLSVNLRAVDQAGAFEIDSPDAAISLLQPGDYRVSVDDAGNTIVALRGGGAQISGSGQMISLQANQQGTFTGSSNFVAAVGPVAAPDSFDRWCQQRDQRWANDPASQYVSADAVGYEDLNGNGDWREIPDYGYAWFPSTVAADWAPYRSGDWVWVSPWGWTWVDDEPWGYAPFHYGRWAYVGGRWCWVPAPPRSRAVYAPALVAWVGGPGAGVSISGGSVGWFPLAPGEVYVPAGHVSPRYLQNINVSNTRIVNTTHIANVYNNPGRQMRYANRSAPGALSVVTQASFSSGQPVARSLVKSPPAQWRSLNPSVQAPRIAPARQSLLGPEASGRAAQPPANVINRTVTFRRAPPPAPARFERQETAIRANEGRPLLPQINGPLPPRQSTQPTRPQQGVSNIERRRIPERSPQFERTQQPRLQQPQPQPQPQPQRQQVQEQPVQRVHQPEAAPAPPAQNEGRPQILSKPAEAPRKTERANPQLRREEGNKQ